MIIRSKKIQQSAEELDSILIGRTDDGIVNTLPEVFDYIDGGDTAFVVSLSKYGITEGDIVKGDDGHYSSSEYDAMYNNMIGFNLAFKDAINSNSSKVIVPKGTYCFCPVETTSGCYQILQIYDANSMTFDFNGSTFKLCFDSTQRSQYHTYNSETVYDSRASLLCVVTSTDVVIENLVCVGDRQERSYIENGEKNQQGTRGICVGPFCDNIEIVRCDVSEFMASAISTCGYQISRSSSMNMNTNRKNTGTFTNYGYYYAYDGWTVTKVNSTSSDFYTISGFIDCSGVYKEEFKQLSKRVKFLADNKIYALWHNSGYSHMIDSTRYITLLTYETTDQELPSRILRVEQLSNFQLQNNERYVRVQCSDEVDVPNPVDGEELSTTTHKMYIRYADLGRQTIRNCYIHDNFLGGMSGNGGDMLICDNVFKKTYTNGSDTYLVEGTNFHFDGEDTNGGTYTFKRNKFISMGGIGKLLFPYSPKRLIFVENHCQCGITTGKQHEIVIANNYFGGSISFGTFIGQNGEYDINGGRTLRRHIEVYGNIAKGIGFESTYLTEAKVYNNRFEITSNINIGKLSSQYNGGKTSSVDFSNNLIIFKKSSGSAVMSYVGRNNTLKSDTIIENFGTPFLENTKYDTEKLQPYTNSYFDKVVYDNLHITKTVGMYVNMYCDVEFNNCVFDAPMWYSPDINNSLTITYRNCTFNSQFTSIGSNSSAIKVSDGTLKVVFIGCTFNVDALCGKFRSNRDVYIEAIDCVAGVKEDTTPYSALVASNTSVSAYNRTLVSQSSGTSYERPQFPPLYYQYFDTTLGYPIYALEIDSITGEVLWISGDGGIEQIGGGGHIKSAGV